jgi:hypothetical protein
MKQHIHHLIRAFRTSQHYLNNGNEKRSREILEAGVARFIAAQLRITPMELADCITALKDRDIESMLNHTVTNG